MANSGSESIDASQREEIVSDRILEVFDLSMEELVDETNSLSGRGMETPTMENVEWIHNFSGGAYLLAEYKPTGYIIIDMASGTFLERSTEIVSPFKNVEGDKYYGGVNEYYSVSIEGGKEIYTNTVYGDILNDVGAIGDYTSITDSDDGCDGTIKHAVVVYGYVSGTSEFVADFGWKDDKNRRVQFSGTLGSLYTYEVESVS